MLPRASRRCLHNIAVQGFNKDAASYHRTRPNYSIAALSEAMERMGHPRLVTDLAAGTGKLTERILQVYRNTGHEVVITAVEPVAAMRDEFARNFTNIKVVEGTAHNIPIETASQDAVFVGQAFHWFADLKSIQELHRVLRPGGHLMLAWNMEATTAPWVARLRQCYEAYDSAAPQYRKGHWKEIFMSPQGSSLFSPPTQLQANFTMLMTRAEIVDRVFTKSYMAILPVPEQEALRPKLLEMLPPLENGAGQADLLEYPHVCDCFIYQRLHENK